MIAIVIKFILLAQLAQARDLKDLFNRKVQELPDLISNHKECLDKENQIRRKEAQVFTNSFEIEENVSKKWTECQQDELPKIIEIFGYIQSIELSRESAGEVAEALGRYLSQCSWDDASSKKVCKNAWIYAGEVIPKLPANDQKKFLENQRYTSEGKHVYITLQSKYLSNLVSKDTKDWVLFMMEQLQFNRPQVKDFFIKHGVDVSGVSEGGFKFIVKRISKFRVQKRKGSERFAPNTDFTNRILSKISNDIDLEPIVKSLVCIAKDLDSDLNERIKSCPEKEKKKNLLKTKQ